MENFNGLTTREAADSAARHGTNALTKKPRAGFFKKYLASFGDPIIRILMLALGVNLLLMFRDANWYESAGIAAAVLLATLISTLSEHGSEAAFEKLQEEAAHIKCRVRRNGRVVELPVDSLVVGDIVCIGAGERIPADGFIVQGEVDVDQSALNGETREARKACKDLGGAAPDAWASSPTLGGRPAPLTPSFWNFDGEGDLLSSFEVFRGSVVCAGEGVMRVRRVGDDTFYGQLASEIQEATIESPLKGRLAQLATTISRFGYAAAVFVVAANLFNSLVIQNHFDAVLIAAHLSDFMRLFGDVMTAITLGITVIVMAVPEGLPMMITVVLSANMRRMLRDNVLVRKLVGIETSGSLNVLFTDKTGTLTKGALEVVCFIAADGRVFDGEKFKETPLFSRVALNCFYNNSALLAAKKLRVTAVGGNSTDRALLEYVKDNAAAFPLCNKVSARPFNSADKFSYAVVDGEATGVLIKGAPEVLLPGCKVAPPASLKEALQARAREGMRLLALCEASSEADATARRNLSLLGFIGIRDEIRPEAREALDEIHGAGVQVVMVTGDNLDTAVGVAEKLGLLCEKNREYGVLTSRALNQLTDAEVKKVLPSLRVIARALPSDKGRLVRLSQEMGLVAGMTGDGVNDAPALKKADVGFVMGDGTEIAKE
ncbi:MAG: HAD family hydrolase, partial [Defluviitaleaceae bacterium]|nr:HAD family hydrolase [Defluviitaleaceae bacterium]